MLRSLLVVIGNLCLLSLIGCGGSVPSDVSQKPPNEGSTHAMSEPQEEEHSAQATAAPFGGEAAGTDPESSPASDSVTQRISRRGTVTEHRGFSSEKVFFATNRRPAPEPDSSTDPDTFFSAELGDLQYGTCSVSIPWRRQPGSLPEPSVLRFEFSQNPAKHIVLMELDLLPDAAFWQQLRSTVEASPDRRLLLFIHGYAATFRDAARRTAQIAWDMNYKGAAMFFSWPAGGYDEGSVEQGNYVKDLRLANLSRLDLITVLQQISARSGATSIHVVAHSMGGHLLTDSLVQMAQSEAGSVPASQFRQLVLAAPDVDARVFVEKQAAKLSAFREGLTVYASDSDYALAASRTVNRYKPLGQINEWSRQGAKDRLYSLIDVSALAKSWFSTGHLYYGDLPQVIRDFDLIFRGITPADPARQLQQKAELFLLQP